MELTFYGKNDAQMCDFAVIKKLQDIEEKIVFIKKTRMTKNQENSAHSFGENYRTNRLAKILQKWD